MFRRILVLGVCTLMMLNLCACGKNLGSAGENFTFEENEFGYVLNTQGLPEQFMELTAELPLNGNILLAGLNSALEPIAGIYKLDGSFINLPLGEGCEYVYALCTTDDGFALLCGKKPANTNSREESESFAEWENDWEILVYSNDMFPKKQLRLSDIPAADTGELYSAMVYSGNRYYLMTNKRLQQLDEDGNLLLSMIYNDSSLLSICPYKDSLIMAVVSTTGIESTRGTEFLLLSSPNELAFTNIYTDQENGWDAVGVDENGCILLSDFLGLYKLDGENFEKTVLMQWSSSGISELRARGIFTYNGGWLVADLSSPQLLTVTEEGTEVNRRPVYILAKVETPTLLNMVAQFNRENKDHIAYIQTYTDQDMDKIRAQIISGGGPDIIATGIADDMQIIQDSQLYVDLYSLLDNDADYSRNSIFPSLLGALEKEGKLYQMPVEFIMYSFLAPASLEIPDAANIEMLLKIAQELKPGYSLFDPGFSRADLWSIFADLNLYRFVDVEGGTCTFNTEEYVQLLEICQKLTAATPDETAQPLLRFTQLGNFLRLSVMEQICGGPYEYVGFPDGGAFVLMETLAICQNSQNPEGAWLFVRQSMSPALPLSDLSGFPAAVGRFDYQLELALAGQFKQMDIQIQLNDYDAQQIRDLIQNTTTIRDLYPVIIDIMTQEAEAYFSGSSTAEQAAERTQQKVSIYLAEQS